jgi:hypothetical protein
MSVMVYSRLGDLLRVRQLTVQDLQRQIAARFGHAVDRRALDRLARAERVRRPDLELAAAAAAVLEVGLNDLFSVETAPAAVAESNGSTGAVAQDLLPPEQSKRLGALFDLRDRRPLTDAEQAELRSLVVAYGHQVQEQGLRALAEERRLPLEEVRAEVAADLERAEAWWEAVQADPARLKALVRVARERQRTPATG